MRAALLAFPRLAAACTPAPAPDPAAGVNWAPVVDAEAEKAAIRAVVAGMEAAWNRGDFAAYMAAFKYPDVAFVSKGEVQKDWQGTLDHYVRDYGASPTARGTLHFYAMKIDILAPDAAMLVGPLASARSLTLPIEPALLS